MKTQIEKLLIVGGGTAGWITAALLSRVFGKQLDITLVESEHIGSVGVGEATIPPILALNNALGIDEREFIRATDATIKLGIEFKDWYEEGHSYMHAFGELGSSSPFCEFYHYFLRAKQLGDTRSLWDFSLNYQTAKRNKFAPLNNLPNTKLKGLVYAYHFDAQRYAKFLAQYSIANGVKRIEGKIVQVHQDKQDGYLTDVKLDNGSSLDAEFFIDCSGLRGLLINESLNVPFIDWAKWLPCDKAIAVQTQAGAELPPYTRAIAHDAGWRWQIPTQSRTGNGFIFSSKYLSDESALETFTKHLDGSALTEPRVIQFQTGMRRQAWEKNCVAIGLSNGFLEPLESTSIHLIQSNVQRFIKHFPHKGVKQTEIECFNRQFTEEMEHLRDFIILHYHQTNREDSAFWRYCKHMSIPRSLEGKIALFRESGKLFTPQEALFSNLAWQQVFLGQGIVPEDYHPLANKVSDQELKELMDSLQALIGRTVESLPTHKKYLENLLNG